MKRLQLLLLQSFVVVQLWQTVFISTRREVGEGGGGGGEGGEREGKRGGGARASLGRSSRTPAGVKWDPRPSLTPVILSLFSSFNSDGYFASLHDAMNILYVAMLLLWLNIKKRVHYYVVATKRKSESGPSGMRGSA